MFLRFNFFPLVWSYLLLAVGLLFLRCLKRLMVTIGRRKVWCGLRQILFHHKGKEDFTESALNTEVIRKQRCTFASTKRTSYDGWSMNPTFKIMDGK